MDITGNTADGNPNDTKSVDINLHNQMSALVLPTMQKNQKGKKQKGKPPRAGSARERKNQGELSAEEDYN